MIILCIIKVGVDIMKKIKKTTTIVLGVLLICMSVSIMQLTKRSDDPDPVGNSKIVHLG